MLCIRVCTDELKYLTSIYRNNYFLTNTRCEMNKNILRKYVTINKKIHCAEINQKRCGQSQIGQFLF